MPMPDKQPDQKRIVASLAADFQFPIDDVARIYEQQRMALCVGAHNTKFVHIFATRNVEEILRKRCIASNATHG